jgi:hypothetical protein
MLLKHGDLMPGNMVSIDQYTSTVPGHLPHMYGKEPKKDKYNGGMLFVNHATGYINLGHQVSLHVGETLKVKHAFEHVAAEAGAPFVAQEFIADLDQQGQTISCSGSGDMHHQNGVAKSAIQTIMRWA